MQKITIPKREYDVLIDAKLRYDYLREVVEGNIFSPPAIRNVKDIIVSFKNAGLYKKAFLKSIEKGLKRSASFR